MSELQIVNIANWNTFASTYSSSNRINVNIKLNTNLEGGELSNEELEKIIEYLQ